MTTTTTTTTTTELGKEIIGSLARTERIWQVERDGEVIGFISRRKDTKTSTFPHKFWTVAEDGSMGTTIGPAIWNANAAQPVAWPW